MTGYYTIQDYFQLLFNYGHNKSTRKPFVIVGAVFLQASWCSLLSQQCQITEGKLSLHYRVSIILLLLLKQWKSLHYWTLSRTGSCIIFTGFRRMNAESIIIGKGVWTLFGLCYAI